MRLLTHNLMACVKCQSFPLDVEAAVVTPTDCEYDPDWVRRMLSRIDYEILLKGYADVKASEGGKGLPVLKMPATVDEVDTSSDLNESMVAVYSALTGFAVKTGQLKCSKCTTAYPIVDFIPNMMVE